MATTSADPVFVDTNILVNLKFATAPFHTEAVTRLNELTRSRSPLWLSRQILREYASTVTRPQRFLGQPLSPSAVVADVIEFLERFTTANETSAVTQQLLSLLSTVSCGGKQVHDANIVATMLVHGVPNLLTHNTADFHRFSHLITVIPLVP
jgi:predicted nucleic acid-binding protein